MILLKQEKKIEDGTYQGYTYTVKDDSGVQADVFAVPPREHSSATAHQRVAFAAMRGHLAEKQEKLQAKAVEVMDEIKTAEAAVEDMRPKAVAPPTAKDNKAVIHLYMVENEIEFDEDDTKKELLDKIANHIG